MTAADALLLTSVLSVLGLVGVLVGFRVKFDPLIPDDWRTWLAPIGVALVVFSAGLAVTTAWR